MTTYRKLEAVRGDLEAARELAADDASFADEVTELEARAAELDDQLTDMLAPRDPHDADDIVLEVNRVRAASRRCSPPILPDVHPLRRAPRMEGDRARRDILRPRRVQEATIAIAGKGDSADGVWSRMKWEGGVHRVQRVPVTESQGRVHFRRRRAGLPGARRGRGRPHRRVRPAHRRLPVIRQRVARGQHHRLGRADHPPADGHRGDLPERALAVAEQGPRHAGSGRPAPGARRGAGRGRASADQASQIRTVDRSERIRTYNFPENRIADHRVNYKAHNLDQVLDGDLDALLDALAAADKQSRLQQA